MTPPAPPKIRRAVYAGSFDPPTRGHDYMIAEGARLFDELIVTVGENPDKRYTFPLDQRIGFLEAMTKGHKNVKITSFTRRYLVDYAEDVGADALLRGIRNSEDLLFEQTMRNVNSDMKPAITTVFLMPPRDLADISSSFVKGLVGPQGWRELVKRFVHSTVLEAFSKLEEQRDS